MHCEQDKSRISQWLNNEMEPAERDAFEAHLSGCADCTAALKAEQQLWEGLSAVTVPEPSADMKLRFQSMLENYKNEEQRTETTKIHFLQQLKNLFSFQPAFQVAYSFLLLVLGVVAGLLVSRQSGSHQQVEALSAQVHEMKEMMMLSLLENPSASERIKGVSYTTEIKSANKEVIEALLSTLDNDPNVNVRLVTLEALTTSFGKEPLVREGLVKSITSQDSPLVQVAIAEAMLKLQEKKAVPSLRKLLEQKDLNEAVRKKVQQTITGLI
jgi:hypothetical protein